MVLPKPIQGWTLTTLREKLVKIGAKALSHAKYLVFQLAGMRCLGSCSRPSGNGSAVYGRRVPRGEACGDGQNGLRVVAVSPECAVRVKFGG